MKRKLWIVTEVFYPDETATSYILTRIAEHLNACFDVHVICGPLDVIVVRLLDIYKGIYILFGIMDVLGIRINYWYASYALLE